MDLPQALSYLARGIPAERATGTGGEIMNTKPSLDEMSTQERKLSILLIGLINQQKNNNNFLGNAELDMRLIGVFMFRVYVESQIKMCSF